MAVREVEESEFLSAKAVLQSVNEMLANPEARERLLQARKIANPNAIIPELDTKSAISAELSEFKRMREEEKAERAREKQEAEENKRISEFTNGWEKQKNKLRDNGWREEGIEAVEAFAQENGIGNLQIAADAWEKRNPPAEPVQPNGFGSWGFFDQPAQDDTFVKTMLESQGENEGALDAEIRATLKDFRNQSGGRR